MVTRKEDNDGGVPLGLEEREVLLLEGLSLIDGRQLSFFDGFRSIDQLALQHFTIPSCVIQSYLDISRTLSFGKNCAHIDAAA